MKVSTTPSPQEELELRQVPLTSPRQKNLQAPASEDVVRSQVSLVARAELLYAGASHLDDGHAGHGQPGHGSPGQDCQRSYPHS